MKNQWSEIELKNAIDLHKNKLSFAEIATILNRTEKAIKIKLGKLGLKQNREEYYENTACVNCGKIFSGLKIENRKFCSSKCAATYNNKIRVRKVKQEKINKRQRERYHKSKNNYCLNCGDPVYETYCNAKCQREYRLKEIFKKIELDEPIQMGSDTTNHRYYKRYLIEKHGEYCMECGWKEINPHSNKVPIELEHIDGNSKNNKLKNLKLLCPNCHSLTSTYKALNKGNGRFSRMKRYKEGKSF